MKQPFAIILATLILLLSTRDLATYVAFKINQEFITNKWCVNINNPEVNCSGKCFLTKKIKSNTDKKKEPLSTSSQEVGKQPVYYTDWISLHTKDSDFAATNNFSYKILISQLKTKVLLQPPDDLLG